MFDPYDHYSVCWFPLIDNLLLDYNTKTHIQLNAAAIKDLSFLHALMLSML